jgi:hypothetical protein
MSSKFQEFVLFFRNSKNKMSLWLFPIKKIKKSILNFLVFKVSKNSIFLSDVKVHKISGKFSVLASTKD